MMVSSLLLGLIMREFGGYIEFEHFNGNMFHDDGIKLNCGRNCLAYLIESRKIKNIAIPYFNCDTVGQVCRKYDLQIRYYHINNQFLPDDIFNDENEWVYLVNYYGQINDDWIREFHTKHPRLIVDNAQAYFNMPIDNIDTIYTCRKFFGVSDGAILYTTKRISKEFPRDKSYNRMLFLLGRFECSASEFYEDYVKNNGFFDNEPIKAMSKLTENILHGIDYESIKQIRTKNFAYLNHELAGDNRLKIRNVEGAFMYPFYIEGGYRLRKKLQQEKIYIPILWPDVFSLIEDGSTEYKMALNILPLPVDQRYNTSDMKYLTIRIKNVMNTI